MAKVVDEEESHYMEALYCKIKHVGNIFKIECGPKEGEPKKTMYCATGSEGKSGGGSLAGFGASGGEQHIDFRCFTEEDMKEKIAESLGERKENIKFVKEEEE